MRQHIRFIILLFFIGLSNNALAQQWNKLPPTPTLPKPDYSNYATINGARIWYAVYGHGQPIILLHGCLCNSNYWGYLVPVLMKNYKVIAMDSRGQGKSSRDAKAFSYDLMASDVINLMDVLKIKKAAIVGWSDGAIIGLDIAMHYPNRISKLFAYGANSNPNGVSDISHSTTFQELIMRTEKEYQQLSPTPNQYQTTFDQLVKMIRTQPHFTKKQLSKITIPVWIVDGDHDEGIKRKDTEWLAANIPNASLLILPNSNHFAQLQDPDEFNYEIVHFLNETN